MRFAKRLGAVILSAALLVSALPAVCSAEEENNGYIVVLNLSSRADLDRPR